MASDDPNRPSLRLVPARPDMGEAKRSGFLPRLPWRYLAGLGVLIGAIVLGFNWRQEQRAAALRVELRRMHQTDLASLRSEYDAVLSRLHTLIVDAAKLPIEQLGTGDSGQVLQGFRGQPGLYLRIPLEQAGSAEQIARAGLQMEPDWIPSCLGWNPLTARELYEIGAFTQPEFIAHVDEENLMKLRVREETLNQRMTKDRPGLEAAMRAPWFMLVLQEGKSRSDEHVRVFVWNLRENKLQLSARVRAQGILLTSRILSQGVTTERGQGEGGAAQANDCSIASALKKLTAPPAAAQHEAQSPRQP
jgi:hypothetical protein